VEAGDGTLAEFGGKRRDDIALELLQAAPMITLQMTGRHWAILIALAAIWGSAFLFIHVAVRTWPPLTYVALRMLIAALALGLFMLVRREPLGLPRQLIAPLAITALLNNLLPFALFGWAQTQIASSLAAILNATSPMWAALIAHAATRDEPLTPLRLLGISIGIGGVAVMLSDQLIGGELGSLPAEIACLVASFSYAVAGVYARRFRRLAVKPMQVAYGQLLIGALIMVPVALVIDGPAIGVMPPLGAIGAILGLGVLCSSFAYILYFKLIDEAGATNALLVTILVPPFAILMGWAVLQETLGVAEFAGLILIALGLTAIDGRLFKRGSPQAAPLPSMAEK
jgi:drug/metabolite transporter (DMT)-like permease